MFNSSQTMEFYGHPITLDQIYFLKIVTEYLFSIHFFTPYMLTNHANYNNQYYVRDKIHFVECISIPQARK